MSIFDKEDAFQHLWLHDNATFEFTFRGRKITVNNPKNFTSFKKLAAYLRKQLGDQVRQLLGDEPEYKFELYFEEEKGSEIKSGAQL